MAFPDKAYILYILMWRTFLYFLMWRTIYCVSWCRAYVVLLTYIAFSAMTHILYYLILHISCISWNGVQHTVFPDVACFLSFLVWRTIYCIDWCGVYIVLQTYVTFSDMVYIPYFLKWRTSCISWCGVYIVLSISWYGVHPVFPDVAYFSYFVMYCISWCGVYIVLETYIAFPDMSYILYFLMWRISCISWCGVQYIVSPDVAYILFLTHT